MNDINRIISELERQRTAIERAIAALKDVSDPATSATQSAGTAGDASATTKKRRKLSPEGRQRIVEATKRRWAARRAEALQSKPTTRKKQTAKKSQA